MPHKTIVSAHRHLLRHTARCAALLAFSIPTAALAQHHTAQAHFTPLTTAQTRSLASRIASQKMATAAIPDVNQDHAFVLRAPGLPDLMLLSGELNVSHPAPAESPQQCGLFQTPPTGNSFYLPIVGPDFKPYSWCEQMRAIGLSDDPGPRPRLILIYDLRAADGNHYNLPFVLVWNATNSLYAVDDATSNWLANQRTGDTIRGARQLLKHHPKPQLPHPCH